MRSVFSSGTRDQYTQPPNGSLMGTPSTSTSVRLTPLGPIPRSDTPCVVGCDARLLVRRKRLNVGICRSTSSATNAGDCLMSCLSSMLTLAGTSPVRRSLRVAVTVTASVIVAGTTTRSRFARGASRATVYWSSANPAARTISRTSPEGGAGTLKRPSGPLATC